MEIKEINQIIEKINKEPSFDNKAPFIERLGRAKSEITRVTSYLNLRTEKGFNYTYAKIDDLKPIVSAILNKYGITFVFSGGNRLIQTVSGEMFDFQANLIALIELISKTDLHPLDAGDPTSILDKFLENSNLNLSSLLEIDFNKALEQRFSAYYNSLNYEGGNLDETTWYYSTTYISKKRSYSVFGQGKFTLMDYYSEQTKEVFMPVLGFGIGSDPSQSAQAGITYVEKAFYRTVLGVVTREVGDDPDFLSSERQQTPSQNTISQKTNPAQKIGKPNKSVVEKPTISKPTISKPSASVVPTPPVESLPEKVEPTVQKTISDGEFYETDFLGELPTKNGEVIKPDAPKPPLSKPTVSKPSTPSTPKIAKPTKPQPQPQPQPVGTEPVEEISFDEPQREDPRLLRPINVSFLDLPTIGKRVIKNIVAVQRLCAAGEEMDANDEFFLQFITEDAPDFNKIYAFLEEEANNQVMLEQSTIWEEKPKKGAN